MVCRGKSPPSHPRDFHSRRKTFLFLTDTNPTAFRWHVPSVTQIADLAFAMTAKPVEQSVARSLTVGQLANQAYSSDSTSQRLSTQPSMRVDNQHQSRHNTALDRVRHSSLPSWQVPTPGLSSEERLRAHCDYRPLALRHDWSGAVVLRHLPKPVFNVIEAGGPM